MIRKGTKVRLKYSLTRKRPRGIAVVVYRTKDPAFKGGVYLEPELAGARWWNVADLERAQRTR